MNKEKEILSPSLEAEMKAEIDSSGNLDLVRNIDIVDAKKAMNVMKTVGVALNKVIHLEKDADKHFQFIIDEASRVSRLILLKWGENPEKRENRWKLNVIEKSIMPYINVGQKMPEDLVIALSETLSEKQVEDENVNFNAFKKEEMIDIKYFNGLAALLNAQREFNFGRKNSLDEDINLLVEDIEEMAIEIMKDLCPELTPKEERVVFYSMILDQLFNIMVTSWNKNAVKASLALNGLNQEELKKWKIANPNGFELNPVRDTFKVNASRLVRITLNLRKTDRKKK